MYRTALVIIMGISLTPASNSQVGSSVTSAFTEQFEAGKHALEQGDYKGAAGALKKAIKLQSECYACYTGLAQASAKLGDRRGAIESSDRAIDVAKSDNSRAYAHNLKGNILFLDPDNSNQIGFAETEFARAVQLDRTVAIYHLNLATAMIRQSKDEAAKPELDACLAASPTADIAALAKKLLADPRRGREAFAPDFNVKGINGEQVSLQQFAGKVLVMDFWATWCPPCRDSVGELKTLTRKYPANKLVLVSVSADDNDGAWREFVGKKRMDWVQYRDSDHQLLKAFAIHSFPTYLVVDGDGIIRTRITGLNPKESVVYRLRSTLEQMPQLK